MVFFGLFWKTPIELTENEEIKTLLKNANHK